MPHLHVWRAITPEHARRMLAVADTWIVDLDDPLRRRAGLLVIVAIFTGLRASELARLNWQEFFWERREVLVNRHKKRNPRTWRKGVPFSGAVQEILPIPDALYERLFPIRRESGPLFRPTRPSTHGTPASMQSLTTLLQRDWHRVRKAANVPYVSRTAIHAARHHMGLAMRDAGLSPYDIRDQLGHSSIAVSDSYTRGGTPHREKLNAALSPVSD